MTPFLLPLMFQIGFGMSSLEAGIMVLVYMSGNLSMKSVTTPLLHRFGFRDVIRVNGALCVLSLVACGLLSPSVPTAVIYGVLFVAGMTRSMNFTSMTTLAFADVRALPRRQHAGGDGTAGGERWGGGGSAGAPFPGAALGHRARGATSERALRAAWR
jgi:hypothetical protein